MNLTHLRYFAELAHTHHYTRAAQNLCITQPSLSHAIFKMEEELGVPLFEKNGKNTVLTVFGEQFLRSVENSLKTLDDGIDFLQRTARGEGVIRLFCFLAHVSSIFVCKIGFFVNSGIVHRLI